MLREVIFSHILCRKCGRRNQCRTRDPRSGGHWPQADFYVQFGLDGVHAQDRAGVSKRQIWGGVKEGLIKVDGLGSKVPQTVQAEVLARQKDIAAGKLHPFHARQAVLDNKGKEVIAKGQTLGDEQIHQDELAGARVQGKLP